MLSIWKKAPLLIFIFILKVYLFLIKSQNEFTLLLFSVSFTAIGIWKKYKELSYLLLMKVAIYCAPKFLFMTFVLADQKQKFPGTQKIMSIYTFVFKYILRKAKTGHSSEKKYSNFCWYLDFPLGGLGHRADHEGQWDGPCSLEVAKGCDLGRSMRHSQKADWQGSLGALSFLVSDHENLGSACVSCI